MCLCFHLIGQKGESRADKCRFTWAPLFAKHSRWMRQPQIPVAVAYTLHGLSSCSPGSPQGSSDRPHFTQAEEGVVKCPLSHGESAMGQFPAQTQGAGAFCRALCGHVRSIGTGPRNLCLIQASPHHVRLLDPGSPGSQFRKCCLSHVDVGNRNGNRQCSSAQQR